MRRIIHRSHRNAYDWSIVQTGVKLVEIGWPSVMFEVGFPNEFKTSVDKTVGELKARSMRTQWPFSIPLA